VPLQGELGTTYGVDEPLHERVPTRPPSANRAQLLTLLGAFWLWFLVPVAVIFQRRARREVEESNGEYEWPRTIWNRPILLWLIVFGSSMALVLLMVAVGMYGDP
jgi:hypothetical protein